MNKLFLILAITLITVGCGSSSSGGGGAGGSEPKCTTPQEMLRCDKVVNIAHRGASAIRPEHTFPAYDKALEDGADILELDVRETSDGVVVVIHDGSLDRTTNCSGQVTEMTFDDISQCDAGYNFTLDEGATYPYRGMGLVVRTLDEVLKAYPDTAMVIEIKQEQPSIIDNFVQVVRNNDATDKITGSSEDDPVVAELRAEAPEIATNMATLEVLTFWGKSFDPFDPTYEPPGEFLQVPWFRNLGGMPVEVVHEGFAPRAHEYDMFVQVFTINDQDDMRTLILERGVDGIMTDNPALLTEVINELGVGD